MSLTLDQIKNAKPQLKEIDVPEWGGSVFIRPLTLEEQALLGDKNSEREEGQLSIMQNIIAPLIQCSITDENGKLLFGKDDIGEIMKSPASAIVRLQKEIFDFNGMSAEGKEVLEKNSLNLPDSEPGSK